MNSVGIINLDGCELTNQDVLISYTPNYDVTSYQYIVYKDSEEYSNVTISNNETTNINLTETGNYKVKIVAYTNNSYFTYTTKDYKIDKEAPIIEFSKNEITIGYGSNLDVYSYVNVKDNVDGEIKNGVKTNVNSISTKTLGKQKLVYEVSDKAGNIATKELTINITFDNYLLNFNMIIIIFILTGLLIFLCILDRTVRLERRLANYTVKPIKDRSHSILDTLAFKLNNISLRISDYIDRFESINKMSKKYQKYIDAFGNRSITAIDFVSKKIILAFTFLITAIIIQTLRFDLLNIYELVIPLLFGFYVLDIIYAYKYYIYRKRIEKDLLQAIIIMNNSFKSGRSITQAIGLVSEQMDGAIADEFKKMSLELSFGLDIEEVFARFRDRIKLEEAAYLTSSIAVLNKTGGNIIKVFTSIEKTLFNRQKLNLELKSLTSSSKLIMYVLTIMPILFVIIINFISPNYFLPLFQNALGFVIIGLILVLYLCYILVVRKIMKVRM